MSSSPSQVVRLLTAGHQVTCCCNSWSAPVQCSNATAVNAMQCNRAHQLSDFSTSGGRMHLVLGHRHERCSDPPLAGSADLLKLFESLGPLRRLSKCSCSDLLRLRAWICSAGEDGAGARRMAVRLRLALPLPSLFPTLARS